jgi:ElaB/YqjD/DUF883 family membrane-anchored ribosome-binding protein
MVDQMSASRSEAEEGVSAKAQEVAGQAQEKAQELTDQAKERVTEAAGQARGMVSEQIDQRSTQAGSQISSTAEDLRSIGEELRRQGNNGPAKLADQVAERAQSVGRYLESSDGDRLLRDAEDFARRQPWAVIAGGLALGFLASRFIKTSSVNRYGGATSTRSRAQLRSSLESSGYPTAATGRNLGVSNYSDSGVG